VKRKQITIASETLCGLLAPGEHRGYYVRDNSVPSDMKIIGSVHNFFNDSFTLILHSEEFEDVPNGEPIPELVIVAELIPFS